MRISENAINSHLDLRWVDWVDISQYNTIDLPIFADMESCLVDPKTDQAVPKLISERSIHAHIGIILSPDALIENQVTPFRDFELDASIKYPDKLFKFEVTQNLKTELSKCNGKAAVSLSQSQHVWDANQFLHLLKLLKRDVSSSKDQFELKSFSQKCVSESKFKFVTLTGPFLLISFFSQLYF